MAKFYGKIGYGQTVEIRPGVHDYIIEERKYFGDVVRNTRKYQESQEVLGELTTGNSISIVADPYAMDHFFTMKYVEWAGVRWTISEVEVQRPRLLLRLGGVYNGPSPQVAGRS